MTGPVDMLRRGPDGCDHERRHRWGAATSSDDSLEFEQRELVARVNTDATGFSDLEEAVYDWLKMTVGAFGVVRLGSSRGGDRIRALRKLLAEGFEATNAAREREVIAEAARLRRLDREGWDLCAQQCGFTEFDFVRPLVDLVQPRAHGRAPRSASAHPRHVSGSTASDDSDPPDHPSTRARRDYARVVRHGGEGGAA